MSHDTLDPDVIETLRSIGDADFLDEIFGLFLDDAATRVTQLRQSASSGDVALVTSHAHALKGAAGNVGAIRVSALAAALETDARAGVLDRLASTVDELTVAMQDTEAALHRVRRGDQ